MTYPFRHMLALIRIACIVPVLKTSKHLKINDLDGVNCHFLWSICPVSDTYREAYQPLPGNSSDGSRK